MVKGRLSCFVIMSAFCHCDIPEMSNSAHDVGVSVLWLLGSTALEHITCDKGPAHLIMAKKREREREKEEEEMIGVGREKEEEEKEVEEKRGIGRGRMGKTNTFLSPSRAYRQYFTFF